MLIVGITKYSQGDPLGMPYVSVTDQDLVSHSVARSAGKFEMKCPLAQEWNRCGGNNSPRCSVRLSVPHLLGFFEIHRVVFLTNWLDGFLRDF